MKVVKLLALLLFLSLSSSVSACDDTLIMMLTAKNPEGEFSKAIRNFSTSLTNLGLALDAHQTKIIPVKLKSIMSSWLAFCKSYSTKPPKDASNDLNWGNKIKFAGQQIGKIRTLIKSGNLDEAHNTVLNLSSKMGIFFEGFGISDEKQMFIEASSNITSFEMYFHKNDITNMHKTLNKLKSSLNTFKQYLPKEASETNKRAIALLATISYQLDNKINKDDMTSIINRCKITFKELRSHILMKEWFSNTTTKGKEQ